MTQKLGWKLAALVLLCVTVSSGTAQLRGRWGRRNNDEMRKWVKEMRQRQAEQAAYQNGQVFVYLTPEGKLKRVASKSVQLAKKTKQEALELHQTKQHAYTQAKGRFLENNPEQKYAPLKPFKPEFIPLKADIVQHTNRAPTLVPKEHYYGLYKVVPNTFGFAVSADSEGIATHGERWRKAVQDIGLGDLTRSPVRGVSSASASEFVIVLRSIQTKVRIES